MTPLFLVRAEQSSSAVLLGHCVLAHRQSQLCLHSGSPCALSRWFQVLKECHAQELLNMGIQTGVMRTSAL